MFHLVQTPMHSGFQRIRRFLSNFSPRTKPQLRFDNFPRHKGHTLTLGTILGINVGVFIGWQVPGLEPLWSPPPSTSHPDTTNPSLVLQWTNRISSTAIRKELFLWKNDSMAKGKYWLAITPSFSHANLGPSCRVPLLCDVMRSPACGLALMCARMVCNVFFAAHLTGNMALFLYLGKRCSTRVFHLLR